MLDHLRMLARDIELGLHDLQFAEVTDGDRIVFIECVRDRYVRCALAAGRFDVATAIRKLAGERIAALPTSGSRTAPMGGTDGILMRSGWFLMPS